MSPDGDARAVIARERAALDEWSRGNPVGFGEALDPVEDATYLDSLGAWDRVEGREGMRAYAASLDGMIPAHDYRMVDPLVQIYGDVGILTFRYVPTLLDGTPSQSWKATSVYRRVGEAWRSVHAHWSLYDPPEPPER